MVQAELESLVAQAELASLAVQENLVGQAELVSPVVQAEPDLVLAAELAHVPVAEADLVPVAGRIRSVAAVPQRVAGAVVLSAEAGAE